MTKGGHSHARPNSLGLAAATDEQSRTRKANPRIPTPGSRTEITTGAPTKAPASNAANPQDRIASFVRIHARPASRPARGRNQRAVLRSCLETFRGTGHVNEKKCKLVQLPLWIAWPFGYTRTTYSPSASPPVNPEKEIHNSGRTCVTQMHLGIR